MQKPNIKFKKSTQEPRCKQCQDNGFILFKKKFEKSLCNHVAYCDKCEAGDDYKYNGRMCQRRTDHYTLPISAYFEVGNNEYKQKAERGEGE